MRKRGKNDGTRQGKVKNEGGVVRKREGEGGVRERSKYEKKRE